jgi:hypothetical protein
MPPLLQVCDLTLHERPVRFRKPFRFGAVTVEAADQVFVTATVEVAGHGRATGMSAELMVPKWFDKNPALDIADTVAELRRSLEIACDLYLSRAGSDTAFGHHASRIGEQMRRCNAEGIPALAAGFGPAEIDKAVLDALLRALHLDVYAGFAGNVMGLDARLAPDLDAAAIDRFLAGRRPLRRLAIRHTVGMADALGAGKDGLPAIAAETGCRHFKLKLGGDPDVDRRRLADIAAALADAGIDYAATLDANEQYADPAALAALCDGLERDAALADLGRRLVYIEQPMPREITRQSPLGDLGTRWPFIIDEADDAYDAFPAALALGYRGVSSKSCKGLYKSLLNGARAASRNAAMGNAAGPAGGLFIAAEDLTCQAGLALQQDSALVAFLGIGHAERNGHHYGNGFEGAPADEADAFLAAHDDLYERRDGQVRLKIRDGSIAIASLTVPGFASAVLPATGKAGRLQMQQEHFSS